MFEMKKLQEDFARAWFHGFILQPGFWYGYDSEGEPAATSTWIRNGKLLMYVKRDGVWKQKWHNLYNKNMLLPEPLLQELKTNCNF